MILGDLIKRNAALHGDRIGLIFEGRRFTHRMIKERACRAANMLLDRGIKPGERVAILSRNCNEMLEIFGAGELTGFITVAINHRLSVPEIESICEDAGPSILFFEADFIDAVKALKAKSKTIRFYVCIGGAIGGFEDYETILASASDAEPPVSASPDDIAYLVYTSGTTGRPKGVMLQHRAMLRAATANTLEGSLVEPTVGLTVMPLFHVGGRLLTLGFFLLGGTVVLHRNFDAAETMQTIQDERVTTMLAAPLMLQRILELPNRSSYDASSMQSIRYASAPMPVPLLRRCLEAFGPIFSQSYGMTECLAVSILKAHEHKLTGTEKEVRRLGSAGQPTLGVELKILRDDDTEGSAGDIGEVLIRSISTMKGYWNNEAATEQALRGGWMHTQDIGYIDEDGFLYILDRKKDMIVSGGENIYSWEVEEALRHHPAVSEVAVIGVPDKEWGESVKACIVLRQGKIVTEDELIAYCRSRIASYKKPRTIDFLETMPRLFNGKLDKKALRAPYWAGQDRQVS